MGWAISLVFVVISLITCWRLNKEKSVGGKIYSLFVPLCLFLFPLIIDDWVYVAVCSFVSCLLVIMSYIDIREFSVHDGHNYAIIVAGLIWHLALLNDYHPPLFGLLIALFWSLLLKGFGRVRYRQYADQDYGFGNGDVFLLASLGVFLGPQIVWVLFWGPFIAAIWVGFRKIVTRERVKELLIPLVPFISIGAIIAMISSY